MKALLPATLMLFVSFSAFGDRFRGKIESIDLGEKESIPHLIKLNTGRVIFLDAEEKKDLPAFRESLKRQDLLEFKVDQRNSLESVQVIYETSTDINDSENEIHNRMSFEPTILEGLPVAQTIFSKMKRSYQGDSQCYNRAHVWAYEEHKRSGLNSIKLFLFFTSRYIRNYRYKWWFHVSPLVLIKEGESSTERVMDRAFTRGPRTIASWLTNFIRSGRSCPKVALYNDYRQHQNEEDCYLIPVSMYFWQPRDIVSRDNNGTVKTQFIKKEVDWSYYEAF